MRRSVTALFGRSSKRLKTNDDEFTTSLITTFPTVKHEIICLALNHDRNLLLICSVNRGHRSNSHERAIDIYTLEGYHVTRKIITKGYAGSMRGIARFTDHMIMICDCLFRPTILTDFSHKFPISRHKTVFVEFDEKGNIYTNGKKNEIAVYSQNLEFKEMLKIDLPSDSIIASLHIRDDTMVVLSCNIGRIEVHTVSRFVRSTGMLVENFELPKFCRQSLNKISIDRFSNIIVCTYHGIFIWQKNGSFSRIMFEGKEYLRILSTNDSQIILITPNGRIHIHRLIDIVNYLC